MIFDNFTDKTATGIEVVLKENEQFSFNVVVLRKTGTKISIVKKAEDIKSAEELKNLVDKKNPVVLSITGKGVIHKKTVNNESPYQLPVLLGKAMPGATLKDFNVQVSETGKDAFVSMIRNTASDAVIGLLAKNGITNITACFLGPFALNDVFEQIGLSGEITAGNQLLLTENNAITGISALSSDIAAAPVQVGNESIPSTLLIAFGSAFSHFTGDKKGIENSELFNDAKEEYNAKRKFERTGLTALVAIFILLLVNFFVFSSYRDKNNELNSVFALNESAIQQYDTLKKEFAFKKQFLEENGLLEHSKTSFYADQLAKALPASISWTSVKINPQKNIKNAEKNTFAFENKMIDISGKCEQSIDLNQWMKEIKMQSWIDKVVLMNYTQTQKNEPGIFTLRLTLK